MTPSLSNPPSLPSLPSLPSPPSPSYGRSGRLLIVTSWLVGLWGCATEQEQVRWGAETEAETVAPTVAASDGVTASDYAKRFPTDESCEREARRVATQSSALADRLIVACIERGDFRRLEGLVKAPWTGRLNKGDAGAILCAKVVAARAGDVDEDVNGCRASGFAVASLSSIVSEAKGGRLIITRVRPDEGQKTAGVIRAEETDLVDGEVESRGTGRKLLLNVAAGQPEVRLRSDGDSVVLARVTKVGEDVDGEPVVRATVLQVFRPAASPTY